MQEGKVSTGEGEGLGDQWGSYFSLYYPHSVVRIIKSRRAGWVGHIVRMEDKITLKCLHINL